MILVTPTDPETDVITAFHEYSKYSQRDISNTNLGQINIGNTKQVWLRVFETERMNIRWSGCYGTQYDNTYGSLSVFGNKIYLVYSSSTSTFGSTSQDMLLTIINLRTGVEVSTKIYGSTSDESTLDIVVNHFGIFMMANIGNGFKLNGATDSYSTQNSNTNFALIYADYSGNIIEIESYDTTSSSNSIGANYPKKLIITRQNKQDPFYSFISTRDDGTTNQGGGVFITKVTNQQALFVTGNTNAACNALSPNCQLCHYQYCFKCLDGYLIQNGVCKSSCDNYFYYQHNDADNTKDINICLPWYETCKTCSGTTKTSCLGCDADKTYDSTYNTWKWITSGSTNLLGLNGVWVSTWDYGLTSTKQNEWMRSWPEDSEDYSSSIDTTARAKSTGINWYNLSKHLYFTSGVTKGYQVQIYESRQYQLFTTTFWVYISSTSANEIVLHSFGIHFNRTIKLKIFI